MSDLGDLFFAARSTMTGVFDASDGEVRALCASAGVSASAEDAAALGAWLRVIRDGVDALVGIDDDAQDVLAAAARALDAVRRTAARPCPGFPGVAGGPPAVVARMMAHVASTRLFEAAPDVAAMLRWFGVVRTSSVAADPQTYGQVLSDRYELDWSSLSRVFREPAPFAIERLRGAGVEAGRDMLARVLGAIVGPIGVGVARGRQAGSVDVLSWADSTRIASLVLSDEGGRPRVAVGVDAPFRLTFQRGRLSADVRAEARASAFVANVGVVIGGTETGEPALLIGAVAGTHAQVGQVSLRVDGIGAGPAAPTPGVAIACRDVRLAVSRGDLGFVGALTAEPALTVNVDLRGEFSAQRGLRLDGSAGVSVRIPVRRNFGPLRLDAVSIAGGLRVAGQSFGAFVTASVELGAQLGPVRVDLGGLGFEARFDTQPTEGRLAGPSVSARPPKSVGLAISAGPVTGAGSLSFSPDAGRYSGSVNLRVGPVALNAFGLIETRAPGISGGYSMVFLVAAGFPGIPLPFGFTLDGVGGVCGIHRTISTEAISQGLRAGTLGGIFFPDNPERNATQILSTLGRVFPPAQDRYTFGPAFKIGWGRPQILDAEIALVVSLPAPIQIHLLGNVVLRVPRVANPIVQLKLAVHGWLDTGAKEFGIDGHLYDSRIALFSISGDLAFRLNWGERPSFLLSIGGFHPEFRAPQGFPTLDRIRFVLGAPSGNPGLTLEAYFAVTSNSLQLGARGEIRAEVREIGTGIRGSAHFDALVIFDPFGFTASMGASLCVRLFGVPLVGISAELTVSGPTPWHIVGDARITVVFDIPFHLDLTFGETRREPAETIRGWENVLRAEIENLANWTSELAAGAEPSVSFASRPEGEALAPLDPSGTLVFVQKRLPLNRTIVKVGERRLAGEEREFDVTDVRLGGRHVQTSVRQEHFAPGQYLDLTNDEKTRRPSFEKMDAGFAVGAATVRAGPAVVSPIEYEVIPGHLPSAPHTTYLPSAQEVDVGVALAASNEAGANGTKQFASEPGAPKKFVYREATYTIATTDTLTPFLPLGGEGEFGAVQERLAAFEQEHPEHRGALQVVPTWEVAA